MSNDDRIAKWRESRQSEAAALREQRVRRAKEEGEAQTLRSNDIGAALLPDDMAIAAGHRILAERKRARTRRRNRKLIVGLGIPAFIVAIYTLVWSTPLYETEAIFTVQTSGTGAATPAAGILAIGGGMSTMADGFQVREYLLSRELMNKMQRNVRFLDEFSGAAMDPISRVRTIPLLGIDAYDVYRKRVRVGVDVQQGVLKLHVQARSPEASVRYANTLLELARLHVNELSRAMNADQIGELESNVRDAEDVVRAAALARSSVQQRRDELSPQQAATTLYQVIATLEAQRAEADGQRENLLANGLTESPALPQLTARLSSLRQQIAEQRSRLVSTGNASLQRTATEFQASEDHKQLADARLQSALVTLAQARLRGIEQTRYFIVVARPEPPVIPLTYRGPATALLALLLAVLGYGMISTMLQVRQLRTR